MLDFVHFKTWVFSHAQTHEELDDGSMGAKTADLAGD